MRLAVIYLIILVEFFILGCFPRRNRTSSDSQITIFDVKLACPMMDYHTKEVVIDAATVLPGIEEYLSQFKGRSMGSSFELANKPEDLLTSPSKLRPIAGYHEASKLLADLLRRIVIIAGVLNL